MKTYKASSKSLFKFLKSASILLNCGQFFSSTPLILIFTHSREPDFLEPFFTRNPATSILGNGKMSEFGKMDLKFGFSAKNCLLKTLKTGRPFSEPVEAQSRRKRPETGAKTMRRTRGADYGEHLEVRLRLFTQP